MGQGPAENIHQMVRPGFDHFLELLLTHDYRLNSKLKNRSVEISDLITDLSDGVCAPPGLQSGPCLRNSLTH